VGRAEKFHWHPRWKRFLTHLIGSGILRRDHGDTKRDTCPNVDQHKRAYWERNLGKREEEKQLQRQPSKKNTPTTQPPHGPKNGGGTSQHTRPLTHGKRKNMEKDAERKSG